MVLVFHYKKSLLSRFFCFCVNLFTPNVVVSINCPSILTAKFSWTWLFGLLSLGCRTTSFPWFFDCCCNLMSYGITKEKGKKRNYLFLCVYLWSWLLFYVSHLSLHSLSESFFCFHTLFNSEIMICFSRIGKFACFRDYGKVYCC